MRSLCAAASLMIVTLVVPGCGGDSSTAGDRNSGTGGSPPAPRAAAPPPHDLARAAAKRFLAQYVEPDGRVARHDQGDDTVSEGQSYALLLAQVAGDHDTFDRAWQWTAAHLSRPDGLLAAHALSSGEIADSN